jgi:hypothetical protein
MRPVDGYRGVWICTKHDLFAAVVPREVAAALERGDLYPMHDGGEGVASRTGDERPDGVILYYHRRRA